jgi:mRNA interferase RelE/StbE
MRRDSKSHRQDSLTDLDPRRRRVDTDAMATVRLTAEADEQAVRLPKRIHARVVRIVARLRNWPAVSGAKPLSGDLAGWYRIRTGAYRIRFRIQGDEIIVDKIGHRKDFYED